MSQNLQLRLLGGFQLEDSSGQALTVNLRKAEALLAYLAMVPGQRASRESLATLLWGEFEQQRARQSLRQTLLALTKSLSGCDIQVLRMESQTVSLTPGAMEVDAVEMVRLIEEATPESLLQAVGLYRGDFLSGLAIDAPDLEEWLSATRSRLQDQVMRGLGDLLRIQESEGHWDAAVETANQALRIDPYREDLHRKLMQNYLQQGMRSSALTQYRTCRDILARELDIEPDETTTALYKDILEQSSAELASSKSLGLPTKTAIPGQREQAAPQDGEMRWSDELIGRTEELEILRNDLAEAAAGRARVVALFGEPGIGKGRLLHEFLTILEGHAATVLTIRGRQSDQFLSLVPWSGLLAEIVRLHSGDLGAVTDKARREIDSFIEESASDVAWRAVDDRARRRLYDAVVELLGALAAESTLVLCFEDVHWLDEESLRLLCFVARHIRSARLLMLLTVRSESVSRQSLATELLGDLASDRILTWLSLRPLSQADSVELSTQVTQKLGIPADAQTWTDQIWALSEGNPQAIIDYTQRFIEKANLGRSPGPELRRRSVSDAQRLRAALSDSAQNLVSAACVLGPRCHYQVLMATAGLGAEETAQAMEELVAQQVLAVDADDVVFLRLRDCRGFYEELVPPRRRLLHISAMRALAKSESDKLEAHYAGLAYHAREGGDFETALSYELRAAEVEMNRGDFVMARKNYQRAVHTTRYLDGRAQSLDLQVALHLGLARVDESTDSLKRASVAIKTAQKFAEKLGDPKRKAQVLLAKSRILWRNGDTESALESAQRAFGLAAQAGDCGFWSPLEQFLARIHLFTASCEETLIDLDTRIDRCLDANLKIEAAQTEAYSGLVQGLHGMSGLALDSCDRALTMAEEIGCDECLTSCLMAKGVMCLWAGKPAEAVALLERAQAILDARGDLPRYYVVSGFLGQALVGSDQSERGLAILEQAIELAERLGTSFLLAYFKAILAGELGSAGEAADRARALLEESRHLAAQTNQPWAESVALRTKAVLQTLGAERDLEAAASTIKAALAIQKGLGLKFEYANSMIIFAKICRSNRDAEASSALYAEAGALFETLGMARQAERSKTMAEALRPANQARA